MDKIVSKIASLGVPGLIFLVAIDATGYAGAAGITTALSALGPGGMLGGVACLLLTGTVSAAISEYGMAAIYRGVVKELMKKGESKEEILNKIDSYPISKGLKAELKDLARNA